MTKLVAFKATFENLDAYLNQAPLSTAYEYFDGGDPLAVKDRAKVEAVMEYHVRHNLYPVFIIEDKQASPLVAEATIDLGKWTKDGLPMYRPKFMDGGRTNTPTFKNGNKVK